MNHYFDCHAWVSQSFPYKFNHILDDLIKFLTPSYRLSEIMNKNSEMKKIILREYLMTKMYFIVLADVWNIDVCNDIQEILPDNQNGSRLVITVLDSDILTSFQLENGENIQLDLVPDGGPLRVTYQGWPFHILYHGSLSFKENEKETMEKPLRLQLIRYSALPFYFKLCCLYLYVFPLYSDISTRQLYQLWIVEGFIPDNNEGTAEMYLEDLINRGFVEAKKIKVGGTINTCSIPDRWWPALIQVALTGEFIHSSVMDLESDSQKMIKRLTSNVNLSELDSLEVPPFFVVTLFRKPQP